MLQKDLDKVATLLEEEQQARAEADAHARKGPRPCLVDPIVLWDKGT